MSRELTPEEVLTQIIGTTNNINEFADEIIDHIRICAAQCFSCMRWYYKEELVDNMCEECIEDDMQIL